MASMDVTPQELRDIEIREAWRGYHRDDVDELLERAAATIEHLEAEVHQLRVRASQAAPAPAPVAAVAPAPAPAPVAAVAPAPAPAPAPPVRAADTDVIQRTLVLAQKAADEAVAEARAKAQQTVGDAEARAHQLVEEAEATAAAIAARERTKLEEEIRRLEGARDTLNADVDALERFEQEYRDRLRRAIEAELDLLSQTSSSAERPALHEVELPAVAAGASWSAATPAPAPSPAPVSSESWSASAEGVVASPVVAAPAPVAEPQPSTVHIEAVPAAEAAWDPAPAGGWGDAPTGALVDDSGEYDLAEDMSGESLDDDAFFASLREAVRDDAPLGSDAAPYAGDEEDTEEHRRLFKRRR